MTPRTITLRTPTQRQLVASYAMEAPDGTIVEFFPADRRTSEQNEKMHAMADDLSAQVPYMGMKLTREQWKRWATARLKKDVMVFDCNEDGQPDPSKGLLVLGSETRRMKKADVSDIIEMFYWMGAKHGVVWGERVHASVEEMRR